jgi:hypothetical protein
MALFALASLVMVNGAMAQDYRFRATIPFSFVVGSTRLPAGTYTFSSPDSIIVQIHSGRYNASTVGSTASDAVRKNDLRLVFNTYGDQYFLSKIFCPGSGLNLELPVSKAEKTLRLQEQFPGKDQQARLSLIP